MARSIRDNTKGRGRPRTTGAGTLIGVRWHAADLKAIDDWRRKQDDVPSRPEAIRRLVQKALGCTR